MGFHLNGAPDPGGTPSARHWQGIVRADVNGLPYLFVTQSETNYRGYLMIVAMYSRPRDGERLRSNRLKRSSDVDDTAPPTSDKVVKTISFNGVNNFPHYAHIGGLQIVGNILAVGLHTPVNSDDPAGAVCFMDISDPRNPYVLANQYLDKQIGQVGFIGETDGTLLLALQGWSDGRFVRFYSTTEAILRNPPDPSNVLTYLDEWNYDELGGDIGRWQIGTVSLQSLNFIRERDTNKLFLMGARNTTAVPGGGGHDYMDLWRVDKVGSDYKIRFEDSRHLFCQASFSGTVANGAAGSGVYVSPTGQLLFYMTEHYSNGPDNSVQFAEFSSSKYRWQQTAHTCTGWVELYDDDNGWRDSDSTPPDRSMVFDIQDSFRETWENFNTLEGFNDKGSSVRWCAPVGTSIVLYEDANYGGRSVILIGTGTVQEIANLNDYDGSGTGFGDDPSSIQFFGFCHGQDVALIPEESTTIAAILNRLGTCAACTSVLSLYTGNYSQALTLDKPMLVEARDGSAVIGAP